MTERMKNSFVIKDDNQNVHWNADTQHSDTGIMGMGDINKNQNLNSFLIFLYIHVQQEYL